MIRIAKEIILAHEIYKHPARDDTWDLDDCDLEEEITKTRKRLYLLQNSRKKQPLAVVFRKENHGTGDMRCHVFHGFAITNEEKKLLCADNWRPITKNEAEQLKKKYDLTDEFLKAVEETVKGK